MTVTWHTGDVREVIATIPDGTVDLVASSPPFLALRSYLPAGHDQKHAEIGSEANPAAYIDMLLGLTTEWGRVLAPHGSIAIELGDTYSGAGGENHLWDTYTGNGQGGTRYPQNEKHPVGVGRRDNQGWPRAKSLALIPQLYAVALAYGINPLTGNPSPAGRWLVRNVIVWHRPNPAVGALGDKVRPSTSYIVIATRSPRRWFDLTAVRTALKNPESEGASRENGAKYLASPGDGVSGGVTSGTSSLFAVNKSNPAGAPPLDTWTDQYDGTHDTWTLTTQPSPLAHYAMWPAKLAERLILMMCPAQVCRVCGEPRRRVEEMTRTLNGVPTNRPSIRARADNNAIGIHINWGTIPTTLGWSDCGCTCSTCGGGMEVFVGEPHHVADCDCLWDETPCAQTVGPCPNCADGRPFRPGLTLDPFAGSGTTLAVADLHGRDAIGIDLDPRNHDLYPARYNEVKKALYGTPAPQPGQGVLAL